MASALGHGGFQPFEYVSLPIWVPFLRQPEYERCDSAAHTGLAHNLSGCIGPTGEHTPRRHPPETLKNPHQAAKYSTPAANSGWSFSPGTFTNVPLL